MIGSYVMVRNWLADVLRVPFDPHPPQGSEGSLRVFRSGWNYYRLRVGFWTLRQVGIVVGFVVVMALAHKLLSKVPPAHVKIHFWVFRWAQDVSYIRLLGIAKTVAAILALIQAPISWAAIRLEYEFRCYLVTDRSLRIREGLTTIRETTLSFANVQQISVEQGPIQRLLGLSDVVVTSAGGGSAQHYGSHGSQSGRDSSHVARFRDVENAEEIRGLIVDRLRSLKDAGLGDRDDRHHAVVLPGLESDLGSVRLAAAQGVLAECRGLRAAIQSLGSAS